MEVFGNLAAGSNDETGTRSRRVCGGRTRGHPGACRARDPADTCACRDAAQRTTRSILTGAILPTLLGLALPTMVVLLAQTAVNIAEAYYVGFLGTDALAGVALVFPVFMLMTMMSNGGLGSGVASAVARAIGAGRKQDADALVFHAIMLGVICRRAVHLGTIRGGPLLYRALGGRSRGARRRAEIFQLSVRRCDPCVDRQPAGRRLARLRQCQGAGDGDAGRRAGADPDLADPDFWFRPGAAARHRRRRHRLRRSIMARRCCSCCATWPSGRSGLTFRSCRCSGACSLDILKVGVPTAVNTVLTNLTVILVTGAVGLFGTTALAAYGIASRLDYVMIPILFGLAPPF